MLIPCRFALSNVGASSVSESPNIYLILSLFVGSYVIFRTLSFIYLKYF